MTEARVTVRKVDLHVGDLVRGANRIMGSNFLILVGLSALAVVANSIVPLVIEGALMVGLMTCFKRVQAGEEIGIETLFKGFDFFAESFIARLVLFGVQMLCVGMMLPSYALFIYGAVEHHDGIIALAGISLAMISIPLSMFMLLHSVLTFALIAEHQVKGVEAVKVAARGIFANPLASAKLSGAAFLVMMLGMLLCGVGIFITIPFGYIMIWLAAKLFFKLETPDELTSELPE